MLQSTERTQCKWERNEIAGILLDYRDYTVFELPTRSRSRAQAKDVSEHLETGSPRHVPNELLQRWQAPCRDRLRFTRASEPPDPSQTHSRPKAPKGQASRRLVLAPPWAGRLLSEFCAP